MTMSTNTASQAQPTGMAMLNKAPSLPSVRGPVLQRKCTCGTHTIGGGTCEGCSEQQTMLQRRLSRGAERTGAIEEVPSIVHETLSSSGQPLDANVRSFMETRFGHDFSQVRVHTDAKAAESAQAVNALAYTVGQDIVFGADKYAPQTKAGRHLLSHELTHVVQQDVNGGTPLQRDITVGTTDDAHEREAEHVAAQVSSGAMIGERVSTEADAASASNGPALSVSGATHASLVQRSPDEAKKPKPKCGPDVTKWFIEQVAAAMKDPRVLALRKHLAAVNNLALLYQTNAQELVEAGATQQILWAEEGLKKEKKPRNPPRGANINTEMEVGEASRASAAASVATSAAGLGIVTGEPKSVVKTLAKLAGETKKAADEWKALVGHGADFDFKANKLVNPTSLNCNDPACGQSLTFCPDPDGKTENCYVTDVPGNVFYALIGRYVGFSEMGLRLGSEYAQLTSPVAPQPSWDPPVDTAAIQFGYSLPLPLNAAALCPAVWSSRSSLNSKAGCSDCSEGFVETKK
jgi:Domain of unknown function (DUF4157)/Bacterial toxin 44